MKARTALLTFIAMVALTHLATRVGMGLHHCLTHTCPGGPKWQP